MKKNQNLRAIQAQRFLRYSIRKFTVGVASVAIASGLAVLGSTNVQAAEEVVNTPATETKAPEAGTNIKTDVAEKVNTSKLTEAIERFSQLLDKVVEKEKTTATITAAKELLTKAQQAVTRTDIQQSEVDKFTSELTSKAYVLESMPKEKNNATEKVADKITEEKVNKNQDPRNGKAIPGKDKSGFRADTNSNGATSTSSNNAATTSTTTTGTSDTITPTNPAQPTAKDIIGSTSTVSRENFTGWDTYTMPFGSHHDGEGDLGVNTPEKKADAADLEFRVFSDQRAGTRPSPGPSNYTYLGKENDVRARVDYGLKLPAEEVQKIIEEAPLWRGKLRYNGTTISSQVPATYFGNGPYEYLLSSIYKLGYEQGIDKVYIKDVSKRIEVTEAAKKAGWTVSDFNVSNFPNGLFYDKETDSVQGVVTHRSPFNYQQVKAQVTFKNTITGKSVTVPLNDHRFGGTAWKDGTPPTLEINNAVKEGKVGEALTVPVEYKDAGASHAGVPNDRRVSYTLTNENGEPIGRTTTITETVGRAILGVSGAKITGTTGTGAATPTELTENETKIPGVGFTIASADMTENNPNGFKGTPTEAGIYRVSIYARDYKETNANEAYAHATFKIAPEVSVKNIHAYDTEVPITISKGASEATITLPDGTNTKVVAKDGKWVVTETTNTAVNVNDEIGTVGETFNLKVLPTATAKAATDTINVTASSENVTATFTRAEVALKTRLGENVTASFNKVTGRWELSGETAEKKTVNSDGTTTWLKRDLYVDVNKDGETIFNVYEYTRTLNAEGKVTAVNNVSRTLTTYNKENAANSSADSATDTNKGMVVTVRYNKGLNKWTADDNSTVTATKTGDKWTISTTSGFNGTIDAVETASTSDKASVLNDAPLISSSLYTTVKGATVDLVKQKSAAVTITDKEDDATTAPNKKETTVTKVTLTSPSGTITEYSSAAEAAAVKLSEVGTYTVKVEVKDSNGNIVSADTETDTGTNKGAETAVNSTTYTITVKDQETNKLYTVEDDTVTNDQLKEKVNPTAVDGFTPTKNDITDIPTTAGKAGQTLPTTATVTYTKDTETIQVETKVDVVVLPKVTPTGVTVLKDSVGLEEAVKSKAVEAANAVPEEKLQGLTVSVKEVKQGTVPETSATGVQTPATVVVEYKDANNNVVATREVTVPVTVVGSTAKKLVVFEGDTVTKDDVKGAVTAGTDGTKGEPVIADDITAKAGNKEVTVPVTYDNGKLTETVSVPVTVLPKATGEADIPKGSTVDKVKEVAKAKAKELVEAADFKGKLPAGATVTVGDITEAVAATLTNEKGTNKGVVNVPATYTVDGTEYTTTVPVTINVLGSETKTVYTVEGTKPDAEKVKNAVPKATPEKVTTLKDTTSDNLTTAVKEKAQAALGKLTLPTGITAELDPNQNYAVPATDSNGDKDSVPVKVQYKDATGTVVAKDTINVPVTVVSSTPAKIVVFEGEKPTADQAKEAVTPGTDGTKGEPTTLPETAGKAGATDVKVDVPVTYDNGKLTETVSVPVIVLPKPEAEEILVAKNSDKEKAKEKVLAKAKKAIEDATFKGKLPADATVEIDNTVPVTIPELTDDTEVEVTVKYTVPGQDEPLTTTVKVPVTVVEGVPQIVPVKETNDVLPDPEKSIDKEDYPEGSTFRYKTPEGQTTPIDVTTPGDKDVIVEVLDKNGNPIVEVPATVRVVESYPKYVPVDPAKKQPDPKENINPNDFPTGTTFEYKDNTPVDTTTPGERPATVVAKLNGQPITEIPATIVVVESKTQYVPVNAENDKKPKPQDSITPDDYPEGSTFEYKTPEGQTTPYDGTTPGEKDVTVVVKDPDGDKLVEVPAKIKVVQGKEQLTPVNAEDKDKPKAEDSITPSDYPAGSTFEYKVPEGQTTPYDGTTPGDKPVTVLVKDKNGNVLVEVPATINVVESKPTPIETPVTNTPLTQDDYTKGMKIPEGSTVKVGDLPDLTTPGEKTPVKVTITLPNGKSYTVDVPVTVTPVKEIETPVTTTPLTQEDYTKGIKIPEGGKVTNVKNIPDLTTPGKKDPVKVMIELPNGKVITVEVPVNVTPVKEIETPVTTTPLTPEDYKKGIKIPEGGKVTNVENIPDLTTPGKKDPVKVTIELPNGKVITVDIPVTVTPVKEIETPVTTTPLTPEDYTKGIKIPEGGKVTNVENIPDLTTPGKKDPVKVTITLPNGKVVTVEVPVNVTPITPIETPVTKDKLTPEDILKQIKVPEGATVKVGDLPDLTTPGKKDPVKVTITLPNGKVVTVEIPVNVTPIEDIVKKQGDPITAEDVEKHIPKGVKVINIGDKPTTDIPGERPSIPVVIELPNGIRVTMNIPVIVAPKVTPVVVPVGTPVTPEDVKKHIELPKGWTVTKVGEIPTTTTPGTKPVVKVEIQLPDGRKITVDVPVVVTPTVRQIVVPQGTPITPDDVKGHIDLPKEPGWEIVEVGEIPTTIPAGVKPSVKVKIKVPTGEIIEVEVPIIVTPKVTPIVVEVGTPITEEDVKKKVDLPEGWEIVEVGEIPTTETPGTKPVVKVKVKLPDGRIITVEVPVTVTPKSQNGGGVIAQNGDSTVQIVTEYLDENGNRITSDKEGKHNPIELEGYEFSHSTTDSKGNTLHHYKKVTPKVPQAVEEVPTTKQEQPSTTEVKSTPVAKQELPNTGMAEMNVFTPAVLAILGGLGLAVPALTKKKDEE